VSVRLALALLLAVLAHRCIERPTARLRTRFNLAAPPAPVAVATASVA